MAGVKVTNDLSFYVHYLRMAIKETDVLLATGTGFIYDYEEKYYLITNGHNVTGINPENNQRLPNHAGFPDTIVMGFWCKYNEEGYVIQKADIDLYEDNERETPLWLIHPVYGYKIDVVAIPIDFKKNIPPHIKIFALNKFEFDNFSVTVAEDVFIIGFPLNIMSGTEIPIWKRGSIATEPEIDLKGLPKILVDTATRSGMSGSPVIYRRSGMHGIDDGNLTDQTFWGIAQGFVGIYSGRIGAENELEAQLGIVWKKHVIDEILAGKKVGTTEFQRIMK